VFTFELNKYYTSSTLSLISNDTTFTKIALTNLIFYLLKQLTIIFFIVDTKAIVFV